MGLADSYSLSREEGQRDPNTSLAVRSNAEAAAPFPFQFIYIMSCLKIYPHEAVGSAGPQAGHAYAAASSGPAWYQKHRSLSTSKLVPGFRQGHSQVPPECCALLHSFPLAYPSWRVCLVSPPQSSPTSEENISKDNKYTPEKSSMSLQKNERSANTLVIP